MTGTLTIIMIFSIPLVAIIGSYWLKHAEMKNQWIMEEQELEKIKHENFILETEKLRLELEKMKWEQEQKDRDLFQK